MTLIVIFSSLITIVRLLTFENKTGKRKLTYGFAASGICCAMATQIYLVYYMECAHLYQAVFTCALMFGAIHFEGNVSHLVKGVRKCIRSVL